MIDKASLSSGQPAYEAKLLQGTALHTRFTELIQLVEDESGEVADLEEDEPPVSRAEATGKSSSRISQQSLETTGESRAHDEFWTILVILQRLTEDPKQGARLNTQVAGKPTFIISLNGATFFYIIDGSQVFILGAIFSFDGPDSPHTGGIRDLSITQIADRTLRLNPRSGSIGPIKSALFQKKREEAISIAYAGIALRERARSGATLLLSKLTYTHASNFRDLGSLNSLLGHDSSLVSSTEGIRTPPPTAGHPPAFPHNSGAASQALPNTTHAQCEPFECAPARPRF